MNRLQVAFFLLFIAPFSLSLAFGAEPTIPAYLTYQKDPAKKIDGLTFTSPPAVEVYVKEETNDLYLVLRGSYAHENYSLVNAYQPIPPHRYPKFAREIILTAVEQDAEFEAIGPAGDVHRESVHIRFPEYQKYKNLLPKISKQRWTYNAALGITWIDFTQTDIPDYHQIMQTTRFGLNYKLNSRLDLNGNVFMNTLTLHSNQPDSLAYLGANLRFGYSFFNPFSHWKLSLNGGWYYLTSLASGIGFQNLSGPQFYPTFKFAFTDTDIAFVYFKYSPISNKISFLSLSNREIAYGAGYTFNLWNYSLTAGLDIAYITLNLKGLHSESNSYTASIGINF